MNDSASSMVKYRRNFARLTTSRSSARSSGDTSTTARPSAAACNNGVPFGQDGSFFKGADRGLRGGQGLAVSESAGTPRSGRVGSGASPAPSKRATKRPRGPGRPDAPLAAPTDSTGASGLAGIVGGGQSQVGISGAMRARDVSRPWPEDDEAAERETVVRRRPGNAASPASVPPHRPAADGGHQGSSGNSPDRS